MITEKYTRKTRQISLNVVQTKIESVRRKDVQKTGIRIFRDGRIGCAGAIGKHQEKALLQQALKSLDSDIEYNYVLSKDINKRRDLRQEIIDEKLLLDEFEVFLEEVRKAQPDFIFSNKVNLTEEKHQISNDLGLNLEFLDRVLEVGLIFKEKTSVNLIDGFVGFEGRAYQRGHALEEVNKICNAFLKKVALPKKKKLPVIFSTGDMTPFMKFLKDLDGNSYGSESSLFSGKREIRIFNTNVTLYQTRNSEDALLTSFFDVEGTMNSDDRFALVKEGVLISPFTDKRTASKYNLPLTGAAAAEYDGIPRIGTPKLTILESNKTAKELLGGEPGILVMVASGGDFTPQGNFASPVQLAYLFDGEKLIGKLPELKISSSLFDMYGEDFIGVSKDYINPLSNDRYLIMQMEVAEM